MVYTIDRLYHGYASVRSYIVEKAKLFGGGLWIRHGNKKMYLTRKDLDQGVPNGMKIPSKYNDTTYDLIDFPWNPIKEGLTDKEAEGQAGLFDNSQ